MTDNPFERGGQPSGLSPRSQREAYERHIAGLIGSGEVSELDRLEARARQLFDEVDEARLRSILGAMNTAIRARNNARKPARFPVNGKPAFQITSFEPVQIEHLTPRDAPLLAGSLALGNLLMTTDHQGGANVYYSLMHESTALGFRVQDTFELDEIAATLERPPVTDLLAADLTEW